MKSSKSWPVVLPWIKIRFLKTFHEFLLNSLIRRIKYLRWSAMPVIRWRLLEGQTCSNQTAIQPATVSNIMLVQTGTSDLWAEESAVRLSNRETPRIECCFNAQQFSLPLPKMIHRDPTVKVDTKECLEETASSSKYLVFSKLKYTGYGCWLQQADKRYPGCCYNLLNYCRLVFWGYNI